MRDKKNDRNVDFCEMDRKKFCRQNDLGAARIQEDSDTDHI